jgi:hypothetical protein
MKILFIYAIVVCIGLLIIGWGLPWMQDYLRSLPPAEALQFLKVVLILLFLGVLPMAFYLWSFGRKVMSSERFPPPHVRVLRDTEVLVGEPARTRGRVIVAIALLLAFLSLFGALYVPYLIDKASTLSSQGDGGAK